MKATMAAPGWRWAFMVLAAALTAAAVWAGFKEFVPISQLRVSGAAQFQLLAAGSASLPVSERSQSQVLTDCYDIGQSTIAIAQPTGKRQAFFETCLADALAVAAASPSHGLAWAVAAFAAGELGDGAGFNAYMQKSAKMGSYEQWLAELRVELIERNFASTDAAVRAIESRDLALMVTSPKGIRAIAQRYVTVTDFRERVTAVVEQQDAGVQRRFVAEVKAAALALGALPE